MAEKQNFHEIRLDRIFSVISTNAKLFLAIILLMSGLFYGTSKYLLTKEYSATATVIIVQNSTVDSQTSMTYSDVQMSQKLTSTYKQIILSKAISDPVLENLGLKEQGYSHSSYKNMLSVGSASNTEVMNITATTDDPELSRDLANETVKVFTDKIQDIMKVENVTILNYADLPGSPSGPNVKVNTELGFLAGLLICVLITAVKVLMDTKVKTEDEVKEILGYVIIGTIPETKTEEGKDNGSKNQ